MNTTREEQLRQRAYRIWESEGRPDGMEAQHWARAERELAAEEPDAAAPHARSRRKPSMVEKAVGAISRATAKKKTDTAAPKASRTKKKD